MIGIAVALVVGLPIGFALADHAIDHFSVDGGEVVNAGLAAGAEVTDIVLVDTFTRYDRYMPSHLTEQLVEGHTVFATIDILRVPNETNWTMLIAGDVSCTHHIEAEGEFIRGVPVVPRKIERAQVECGTNETVFVTPDPFYNSSDTTSSSYTQTAWSPTGRFIPYVAPSGVEGDAQEWTYDLITTDWLGNETRKTLYAWSVPVLEPWMHSDGRQKSWYCPLPEDRLLEMGITRFTAYHESEKGAPQFV